MSARSELVALVGSGRLTPERLTPGRAVDLGCGAGANAVFLAQAGFDVVGIDFSPVALGKARRAALIAGVSERVRLVRADLTAPSLPDVGGPFDLLVDYGTLDDLAPRTGGRSVRQNSGSFHAQILARPEGFEPPTY